jgi:hypothetical protein
VHLRTEKQALLGLKISCMQGLRPSRVLCASSLRRVIVWLSLYVPGYMTVLPPPSLWAFISRSRGGARALAPRGHVSRRRDTGTTIAALSEGSRRCAVTIPLLVRREKHTPVQAVVSQVGTKDSGHGVAGSSDAGEEWAGAGQLSLPKRKGRCNSSLYVMAAGVLRFLAWWTFPPQLRIRHGTYSLSYYTLRRCQEGICVPLLRRCAGVVQDRRVLPVGGRDGDRLGLFWQGEVTPVAPLHRAGPVTDLLDTEPLGVGADHHHIAPE